MHRQKGTLPPPKRRRVTQAVCQALAGPPDPQRGPCGPPLGARKATARPRPEGTSRVRHVTDTSVILLTPLPEGARLTAGYHFLRETPPDRSLRPARSDPAGPKGQRPNPSSPASATVDATTPVRTTPAANASAASSMFFYSSRRRRPRRFSGGPTPGSSVPRPPVGAAHSWMLCFFMRRSSVR